MARDRYGNDSRSLFLVIRGALWGVLAGLVTVLMLEVLGLITSGFAGLGTFIVLVGPAALGAGIIAGILVALVTWAVVRKHSDDEEQKRAATRFAGGASLLLAVAGPLVAAGWFTAVSGSVVQWWLLIALIVLGVGVPVAGLAVFAAGKVHDVMVVRFPRG
ncbi:MAG TPA: hypothetical protein H9830_12385 [Candidatus Agrococcus pullicola]|uniref:Uncharacterized protein n=1 Tax=Candidatus Agrococcus pullicola TaxID=2838429 RepID=A0A9D1YWJ3_9MICO|nr:hypothetical protein [Candidatus Agrococcus pullicola]